MAYPKLREETNRLVIEALQQEQPRGHKEVLRALAMKYPDEPMPNERTTRNWIKDARERYFSDIPTERETIRQYLAVYWPESFTADGPLPFEAGPHVVALYEKYGRITEPVAVWYWRITLLAAEAPQFDRLLGAGHLAILESEGRVHGAEARSVESYFMFRAWEGAEQRGRWKDYLAEFHVPEITIGQGVGSFEVGPDYETGVRRLMIQGMSEQHARSLAGSAPIYAEAHAAYLEQTNDLEVESD